jgi:AcrR family transcriptional regulator
VVNGTSVTPFDCRTLLDNRAVERYRAIMQTMTRRQQQQATLRRDVLDAALSQLDEGGSTAVNWRGLARAVGVSPSTLYTYFESIDALYTALILDVYAQMQTEVARRVEPTAPAVARVVAACDGYRRFATTYPARFTLVFTDVLPGYAAPPGGPTVDAQVAVMTPLIEGVTELIGAPGSEFESLSPAQRQLLIASWARLHGFVSLEVNHHLDWVGGLDEMFASTIDAMVVELTSS